jgi:hypothetical protein
MKKPRSKKPILFLVLFVLLAAGLTTVVFLVQRSSENRSSAAGNRDVFLNFGRSSRVDNDRRENSNSQPSQAPVATTGVPAELAGKKAYLQNELQKEIQWGYAHNQRANGVIAMNGTQENGWISPYMSLYFVKNALIADPSTAAKAKKYLQWHIAHLNRTPDPDGLVGTMFEYNIKGNTEVPSYKLDSKAKMYDSTDSFVALFLTAMRTYAEISGDKQFVLDNKPAIDLTFSVYQNTWENGLTWGTKTWRHQYAMDNFEVNTSLGDLAYIYRYVYSDPAKANEIETLQRQNRAAIESNTFDNGVYIVSKQTSTPYSWSTYYPDALVPQIGLITGYINPNSNKAENLVSQFERNHPDWINAKKNEFPMAFAAHGMALRGRYQGVLAYHSSLRQAYPNRTWTYHIGESAFVIGYLNELISKAN